MDEATAKKIVGAVYSVLNSRYSSNNLAACQQELKKIIGMPTETLPPAGLETRLSRDDIQTRVNELGWSSISSMKEAFKGIPLDILVTMKGLSIAAFRNYIRLLADYITLVGADQAQYDKARVGNTYDHQQYPHFALWNEQIPREGLTWKLPVLNEKNTFVEVSPISNGIQIPAFRTISSEICYFDPHRNHAQMYLYAAHRYATMLGVWHSQGSRRQPLGIVPLLLLQPRNVLTEEERLPEVPYLYAEAALLKLGAARMLVETTGKRKHSTLADALVDIVARYASLRAEEPFPVIGTCRKDDSPAYQEPIRGFIEAASYRWRRFVRNKVRQQPVDNPLGGKPRPATDPRFTCTRYLELPEDAPLLHYLQQHGYPFDTLLFHSQDFLDEEKIRKERGDTITSPRRILYGDWGEMRGWTQFVPIPEFYPVQQERIFAPEREVKAQ